MQVQAFQEKLSQLLADQRSNLILWIPVFLGLGSCLYFSLSTEPSGVWIFPLFAVAAIAMAGVGIACARADDLNRFYLSLILISVLFWTVAGFTAAKVQTLQVATPMLAADSKVAQVQGTIRHLESLEGRKGALIVLEDVEIERWEAEKTPRKIRLNVRVGSERMSLGDRISVLAKLHATSAPVTPGAYDFQRFYYFKGIGALGFTLKEPEIISRASEDDISLMVQRLRGRIAAVVHDVIDSRVAGIGVALMTGDRAAIEAEDWEALRYSGLAHIISISGLHVVLFAAPVFFFVRLLLAGIPFIALRWPIKKIAACTALIACTAYVALVVPTVPTFRALLMTGVGLIAIMLDRSPFSMRLVAFSAAVVLILSPDTVLSASFQMSFAAVIGLVAIAEVMRPHWNSYIRNGGRLRKVVVYFVGAMLTSAIATLATSPFSSFHFQQIAVYSVLANMLAMPITGLIVMPMLILSFILLPFGAAEWTLRLMGLGIQWMLDLAQWVSGLPGAVIHTPAWPLAALVLFSVAGLCLVLLSRKIRWICVPLALIGAVIILLDREPVVLVSSTGKAVMVNTGQGAYVASKHREKFAMETWQKRINVDQEQVVTWRKEGQSRLGAATVSCDAQVCRIELPSIKISTGQSLYDLKQDCEWADIMIVPGKAMKPCDGVDIYDRWRFMKTGALAIMPDGEIRTVRDQQGLRPWSTWLKDKPRSVRD
jgi:competence protein ComEC